MAAPGEKLQGAITPPSTYPNPVAQSVNFHPMGWAYRDTTSSQSTADKKKNGVTWEPTDSGTSHA